MPHNGPLSMLQASFAADDHSADPWSFHIKFVCASRARVAAVVVVVV